MHKFALELQSSCTRFRQWFKVACLQINIIFFMKSLKRYLIKNDEKPWNCQKDVACQIILMKIFVLWHFFHFLSNQK
jgi:hypothetical protein